MTSIQALSGKQFPDVVIPLIDEATRSIRIVVFDWRVYPDDIGNPVSLFNQALLRAKRRGVNVQIVCNVQTTLDWLVGLGFDAVKCRAKNVLHAKMMIVDESVLVIGSHNYTQSAFEANFEISALISTDQSLDDFVRFFDGLRVHYN